MNEVIQEVHSAFFEQVVTHQANLAFVLLGKLPNPETGETMRDLEAAQVFINLVVMPGGEIERQSDATGSPPL